ncbi:MAG TPA: hypothetical protein PLJ19_01240 [Dysgonamonadaceae bacterium]|nr:hypothetical protein [Dysgonamonadaceae bacterium]
MDEFIKQRVFEGFEEGFNNAVQKIAQQHPMEWENDLFYASAMTLVALNETKNVYKQMLKNNNTVFHIQISEVDSFIDSIGEKIQKKYFY